MPLSSLILPRRFGVGGKIPDGYKSFARVLKRSFCLFALALAISAPVAAAQQRLMVLGDSLTAGYGLPQEEAFPVRLEAALRGRGMDVEVINAGVSGDTSAGGLARLDWALADRPTHAIVELGANDALRGIDPAVTRRNLGAILARLKSAGIPTMIAGMYAPPNWGKDYAETFANIYPDLAREYGAALYPFFLDGVAANPSLNQPDGIHPNEKGVAVIVARILPQAIRLLTEKE